MTTNDNPSEPSDEDRREEYTGVLARVVRLLRTISDADAGGTQRRTGHFHTKRTRVDYEYSVSIGLDTVSQDNETIPGGDHGPADGADDTHATMRSPSIEIRSPSDTERVVVADLPGISETEFDVTFDDEARTLTLWQGTDRVERVTLAEPSMEVTDVTINNQVLRVKLQHDSAASDGGSS